MTSTCQENITTTKGSVETETQAPTITPQFKYNKIYNRENESFPQILSPSKLRSYKAYYPFTEDVSPHATEEPLIRDETKEKNYAVVGYRELEGLVFQFIGFLEENSSFKSPTTKMDWLSSSPIAVDAIPFQGEACLATLNSLYIGNNYLAKAYSEVIEEIKYGNLPRKIIDIISSFEAMSDNWNGYNAPAPSTLAINNTIIALNHLFNSSLIPTIISASVEGGIALEFHFNYLEIYIEINNHGKALIMYKVHAECYIEPEIEQMEYKESSMNLTVAKIKNFLYG